MISYFHPATYNVNAHFPQNGVLYLHRNEVGNNWTASKTNTGENPDAFKRYVGEYQLIEPANQTCIGNYGLDESTLRNGTGAYNKLHGPAVPNYFGAHYHAMRNYKEECLDQVLRHAPKNKMTSLSTVESALASDPVPRSYLRSLKRKKLKSFMVRDLIADENSMDTYFKNLNMLPNMPPTPPPEHDLACNKSVSLAQDATKDFFKYFKNPYEPSFSNSEKSCDTVEPAYKTPTKYCCDFVPRESSNRSPESLGSSNDISSTDSSTSPCGKSKRVRTIFTYSQLQRLEMEFEKTHYMVGSERSQLASELNLSESQVKVWFQNRRIKQRKQFHERQKAMLSKLKESQKMDSRVESEENSEEERTIPCHLRGMKNLPHESSSSDLC